MMTLQPVLALAWNPAVGIPLLIVGVVVLALIWLFGQPKKEQQGRRRAPTGQGAHSGERREPTLGEAGDDDGLSFSATDHALADEPAPQQGELDVGLREELERLGATLAGERNAPLSRGKLAGQAASIVDALRAPSSPPPATATPAAPVPGPAPAPAAAAPQAPRTPPRSDLGR